MDLVFTAFSEVSQNCTLYFLTSCKIGLCILCGLTELDFAFSEVLQDWTMNSRRSDRTGLCIL